MSLKYKEIKCVITALTGLRIGGKEGITQIGDIDNPIIRNSLDGFPYIPGSSLKGKMRFLLEHYYGKVKNEDVHQCDNYDEICEICNVFGIGKVKNKNGNEQANKKENEVKKILIGRAIFRDAFLTKESKKLLENLSKQTGMNYSEIKIENVINRKTGGSNNLRNMERIPAGVQFDFTINFRIFEDDDEKLLEVIKTGFKLLENDSLGSSGSRGYGKIKIDILNNII